LVEIGGAGGGRRRLNFGNKKGGTESRRRPLESSSLLRDQYQWTVAVMTNTAAAGAVARSLMFAVTMVFTDLTS
jgi:hypothetical protein